MENILLIKINQSYKEGMSPDEIRKITSNSWKVDLKPNKNRNIEYYCAVYQKKIIEVYKLLSYEKDLNPENIGRYILNGEIAPQHIRDALLKQDVSQVHKGKGNPIKYTNKEAILDANSQIKEPNPVKINLEEQDLFITRNMQENIIDLLDYKKNIILQGAPGVGKTYIAENLIENSYSIEKKQVLQIQFHQSYSYEDFIEGYRPNKKGNFELQDGIFKNFIEEAINDDNNSPYFLIIDEINRGNLSKIFGELFMLIEKDKRGKPIKLAYSKKEFYVPTNVYIIGTMNTADRSLDELDFALRRRFSFIYLESAFSNKESTLKFENFLISAGANVKDVQKLVKNISNLNKKIIEDYRLGKGFEIGHAYFTNVSGIEKFDKWYSNIIKFEIKPLLEEYYFKNPDAIVSILKDIDYEI